MFHCPASRRCNDRRSMEALSANVSWVRPRSLRRRWILRPITTCGFNFATHRSYRAKPSLRAVVYAAFILVLEFPPVKQSTRGVEIMKPRIETSTRDARIPRRYRVLCVDDNSAFLMALRLSLGASGFEVVTASHGVDALMQYKAQSGKFDAIVTDNDMPKMNGSEFIRSIRRLGFQGRIVLMSGNLSLECLRELQDCQISGFFTKPFEIGMLVALLSQGP